MSGFTSNVDIENAKTVELSLIANLSKLFTRFPTIFLKFMKNLRILSEGQTNISEDFRIILVT